jgi:hypothetical protein
MGGEADFAAAGCQWQILVCFLLGSATDREFLGAEFPSIDRTRGCCFLALYCIYLILNPSINHEADRDRLLLLDRVNYVSSTGQIPAIEKASANTLKNLILQKPLEGCRVMTY